MVHRLLLGEHLRPLVQGMLKDLLESHGFTADKTLCTN